VHSRLRSLQMVSRPTLKAAMHRLLFYLASRSWVQFTEPLAIGLSHEDGAKRIRTADPLNAIQVLYQLSYSPLRAKRIINTRLKDAQASTPNFPLFG